MNELEMIKNFFDKLEFKMNYTWGRANEWYRYKVTEDIGKLSNEYILKRYITADIDETKRMGFIAEEEPKDYDVFDKITFNEFCYILGRWSYDTTFMQKYAEDILQFITYKYKITIPEPKDNYERIQKESEICKYTRDYVCRLNENEAKFVHEDIKGITNVEDIFYSYLYSVIDLDNIYRVNYYKCHYTFGLEYEVFILRSKDGERAYVIDLQMWD